MQLQPFRRPNIIDAETTRDAIVRHLAEIRELYAQRNRTLVFEGKTEYITASGGSRLHDVSGYDDPHLNGTDFIATIAEPPKPKPGDLHDWDKLVDGCLYIDFACGDSRPYYIMMNGHCGWYGAHVDASTINTDDVYVQDSLTSAVSRTALVVAVGLKTPKEFLQAMKSYDAVRKSGGAK